MDNRTVQRTLKNLGYASKKPIRKPIMSEKQVNARYNWCIQNRKRNWGNVVFSDESTFQLTRNTIKAWCKNKRIIKPIAKHCVRLHVWGEFWSGGKLPIFIFKENMDSKCFQNILATNYLPFISQHPKQKFILQMDNDPKHKSKSTQKFMQDNKINLIDWPSNSPDLNPIENVCELMENQIEKKTPRNEKEFMDNDKSNLE